MIAIRIGNSSQELNGNRQIDENWINQQINLRRQAGETVCVRVTIKKGSINLSLNTPGCPAGGGGRLPTDDEQQVFDLWDKVGLDKPNFHAGNLIAFLKQVDRLIQ